MKNDLETALRNTGQPTQPVNGDSPVAETKEATKKSSRAGKRHIAGYFTEEVHKQLKILGAEKDLSIQDMLAEALNEYFKMNDKPPIAE